VHFWLKFFHIAAMAVWFTGLFFLPRVFVTRERFAEPGDDRHLAAMGKTLYFGVMTPAGVVTVLLGIVLMSYGFDGAWLPIKLGLVAVVVLLHIYIGQLLFDLRLGHARHGAWLYRILNWCPLLLLLGIAALAAAKPGTLDWPGYG
jgi:protoporphyrinogen IX oxidase